MFVFGLSKSEILLDQTIKRPGLWLMGSADFYKQCFFASPVPKKKTWEAMRELYQEHLRVNHEVIGDIGRY